MKKEKCSKTEKNKSQNLNSAKRKISAKEAGITLIALVITIIVLLILTGVSISAAINGNGLFARARKAGNVWQSATENEQKALDEMSDTYDDLAYEYAGIEKPIINDEGKEVINPGEKVTTSKNDENNVAINWRLFYKENGRTYLKADPLGYTLSDNAVNGAKKLSLVEFTKTNNTLKEAMENNDIVTYKPSKDSFDFFKEQNPTWRDSDRGKEMTYDKWDSLNLNEKVAIYLSDPDVWSDYKADLEKKGYKVKRVWGAPSADLYCKAFNSQSGILNDEKIGVTQHGTIGYGWNIKNIEENEGHFTNTLKVGKQNADKNGLYFEQPKGGSSCWWWLSSPSCTGDKSLCYISAYRAAVSSNDYEIYSMYMCISLIAEI